MCPSTLLYLSEYFWNCNRIRFYLNVRAHLCEIYHSQCLNRFYWIPVVLYSRVSVHRSDTHTDTYSRVSVHRIG